jgi:hypothetical protein
MKEVSELKQPKNETEIHFVLKEIAKYLLWTTGYNKLATEVGGMYSFDFNFSKPKKGNKNIIDAVGVKTIHPFVKEEGYKPDYYEIKGIEAKASLTDFKNGFCAAPALTYIIAPKNIIPVKLIPCSIGLIEVDFETFEIKKGRVKIDDIKGVKIVIRAKRRIDSRFKSENDYRTWSAETLERVAYRCSQELLFWHNSIEFA